MILFLIYASFAYLPNLLADCPLPKTYGLTCQYNCTNCSTGCDVTGACFNGTCLFGFYGTGCQASLANISLEQAPILTPSNCLISVSSINYTNIQRSIFSIENFVVYAQTPPTNRADYTLWLNKASMTCSSTNCVANIIIPGGTYWFGVYFSFFDLRFADAAQSLVSPLASSTCNTAFNPTTVLPSSTASAASTASTASTTSTTSTASTSSTASSTSTASTASTSSTARTPTTANTGPTTSTTSTITTLTTTPTPGTTVQRLVCYNKSSNSILISWSPPANVVKLINYSVTVQRNNNVDQSWTTKNLSMNLLNLQPGNLYTIIVATNYEGSLSSKIPIDVCTAPAIDVLVDRVQISNLDRKSMNAMFPVDLTNYTCSTNIYRIGIIKTVTSSRRKRSASTNSVIHPAIILQYNSSQFPPPLVLSNLEPATNYTIYAEIYTNVDGNITFYYSTTYQQTNGPTDAAIVGIVLGLLLLLIILVILILLLWYWKRKQKSLSNQFIYNNKTDQKEINDEKKPRSFAYWSEIIDRMQPRVLVLNSKEWTDYLTEMDRMKDTNKNYFPTGVRFIEEYDHLPGKQTYPSLEAELNYVKNKSQDILPYDHNRVKLRTSSDESDYINATFIDGYIRRKAYIAAQSPFDNSTANDFWKMIYDHNVGQIVMLTESEHNNITTSIKYWPSFKRREKIYGTINVRFVNEVNFAYYNIREFEINDINSKANSQRTTQYQFPGWPHDDIPENIIAFLDFYQSIKVNAQISNGPLLVHCGSGISQTAVFIAFDILNQKVVHENSVNVFRVVAEIRRSRSKMVTNAKQYMFIYDLLYESLLCGQYIINANVRKVYKLLQKINPQSQVEYLHEQFYILQTYHNVTNCHCPKMKEITFLNSIDLTQSLASRPSPSPSPSPSHCPKMKEITFLDSIDLTQSLASCPSPSANSEIINEFWKTIYDEKIEVIIDLHTTEEIPVYIRDSLQNFDLLLNSTTQIGNYSQKFDITLCNVRDKTQCNVCIFQLRSNWVNDDDIYSAPRYKETKLWVDLIDILIDKHSNNWILAHCLNGWSKSGLFLACFNIALKMHRSKYVMVYNVVKGMKFYQYKFVTSYAQFKFIYQFLKKWVEIKMPSYLSTEYSGLLTDGNLYESLFTHEQTTVLRPDEKQKYAPSLYSFGGHDNSGRDDAENVVHYQIGSVADFNL